MGINEELIEKIRSGDELAKEKLAERNMDFIHYMANKWRNSGIEYDELVGMAQVGFVKAMNKYNQERGNANFITYCGYIISNEIGRYYYRKFKTKPKTYSIYDPIHEDLLLIDTLPAEERLDYLELSDYLSRRLKTDRDKKVFYYYLHGFKQREISQKVGITQAHVSRTLRKISDV